jgi:hypothetical protein
VFQVNKKYGNSALATNADVAYSEKGELGNNENKNKIKNLIREERMRTIKESAIQDKNGAGASGAESITSLPTGETFEKPFSCVHPVLKLTRTVFWSVIDRHFYFGGTCCLHLQGRTVSRLRKNGH